MVYRALGVRNSVLYSYLTEAYQDGTAPARLLIGLVAEAEYATLSFSVFLRSVQHGPVILLVYEQMMSTIVGRGASVPVIGVLVGQRFRFGILGVLMDTDVDSVLVLSAIARGVEVDCNSKPILDWFLYTPVEGMIHSLPASAPLGRISAFGKKGKDGGMPTSSPERHGCFACCRMSKAYARKAWRRFNDTGSDLTNLLTLGKKDALMKE